MRIRSRDTLVGGEGNDDLDGGDGDDTLSGGPGDDTLNGGPGDDTLKGGEGDDTLNGGEGDDTLNGGPGDDTYVMVDGGGDTVIETAGGGEDKVMYAASADGGVMMAPGVTATVPENVEMASGTSGNDDITIGGTAAAVVFGLEGDDMLTGNAGDDTLVGCAGSNTLEGGAGMDIFGVFKDDNMPDTIKDFATVDKIHLKGYGRGATFNVVQKDDGAGTLLAQVEVLVDGMPVALVEAADAATATTMVQPISDATSFDHTFDSTKCTSSN